MSIQRSLVQRRGKAAVALGLTFAAGCVDITGYLALYHIFTAHMTGTTVHLGENLITRNWPEAAIAGSVLLAFVLGSIAGRVVIEIGARRAVRRIASITPAIEALLLVGFVIGFGQFHAQRPPSVSTVAWLLAMLAAAMGIQTATLTRIGPLTVHTTFVTGMINKFAQLLSHVAFDSYDLFRWGDHASPELRARKTKKARETLFIFSIWCLYFAGAVVGTLLYLHWKVRALTLPMALLACAIVADQFKQLSVEEEREQFER